MLSELDLTNRLAGCSPVIVTGSFVSGLMVWRDLDVMALGGPRFSPTDVLAAIAGLVTLPGLVGFGYADERGPRSPTGETRDERYHVPMTYVRPTGTWRLDLTFWLHDPHQNVAAWHQQLRDSLTSQQRTDILNIKDVWHRRPDYPDTVSGFEIYTAVLDHGVRTPQQFQTWLAATAR
ncbi:hypothetical protein GCM10022236_02490 [Microlunatus ginsengisoli]|uniref:Uncharacterized protein n=1 Tax=Microlunatus ginsengisoli TaxID=363863 RepID=A0ABP6ZF59_9ACTN